jgi:uncharacterized membrane-anchored protein
MNRKAILLLVLGVAAAAQLAVPGWMIRQHERTLAEGRLFKFRTQPVDPADAFRGRYVWVRLQPDSVKVPNASRRETGQKAYAVLGVASDGFATVERLEAAPPANAAAVAVRLGWTDSREGVVHFSWPLDRYYMEETKAPAAEAAYRGHNVRTNQVCYVTVRVRGDNAVLENLFIAGKPIREFLQTSAEETK